MSSAAIMIGALRVKLCFKVMFEQMSDDILVRLRFSNVFVYCYLMYFDLSNYIKVSLSLSVSLFSLSISLCVSLFSLCLSSLSVSLSLSLSLSHIYTHTHRGTHLKTDDNLDTEKEFKSAQN